MFLSAALPYTLSGNGQLKRIKQQKRKTVASGFPFATVWFFSNQIARAGNHHMPMIS